MTDVQKLAAEEAQHWFDFRCRLFTMTHGEYQQFKTLVAQICRSKAEQVEDPVLQSFIEDDPWFKPTPETLMLRSHKKMMDDPETVKRIAEMEEQVHKLHDEDEIDLKDLNDDA